LPQPVAQPKLSAVRTDRDAVVPARGTSAKPQPERLATAKPASQRKGNLRFAGVLPPARIPPESIAPARRVSAIGIAVGVSIALHAIAMTIHFTFGSGRFTNDAAPLQIALVNARSASKPAKADILAQANLDGGGNTEKDRRAKTPLPVLPNDTPRQNVAVASSRADAQENVTREMLTQLRSGVVVPVPEPKPVDESERTDSPTANELIGAQAKEYRFARYVEDWRMKVERIGNTNYPEAARQNRLYGSLILSVSIRADGSIENVEVKRKSGQRVLDAAAVKIVEMAGPYAPFPDDIRRDTDILNITRTWTFAKGDELHSD